VSTLQTVTAPLSSSHPSQISWAPFSDPLTTSCSGAAGKGAGRFGWIGVLQEGEGGVRLYLGDFGSSCWIVDWKHSFYSELSQG
jgi:hypothetical protein